MKALSLTLGATALAQFAPSFAGSTQFQQVSTSTPYQQYSPNPFAANKPWQAQGGSTPSKWASPAASEWTPAQSTPQTSTQGAVARPRGTGPANPALAGRSPSEQLQITKCRSAQSCEKCRQLNCYWDVNSKVTNRCIALGLESAQVPVEAGEASNLGFCPSNGQPGFVGVNWLAIENAGVAVPNLEGMSDANVQQWLSLLPNYDPDATESNYPAGVAFRELLPSAAAAYASGNIPSTTPWVSFFDSYLNGGYNYDGYYDLGYSYDLPAGGFLGGNSFGGSFSAGGFPSTGFPSTGFPSTSFPSTGFPSTGFPSTSFPATAYGGVSSSFASPIRSSFGSSLGVGSTYSTLPTLSSFSTPYSTLPSFPSTSYPLQGSLPVGGLYPSTTLPSYPAPLGSVIG